MSGNGWRPEGAATPHYILERPTIDCVCLSVQHSTDCINKHNMYEQTIALALDPLTWVPLQRGGVQGDTSVM